MTEEFKKQIETEARQAVTELLAQAKLKKGDVFVVGCSSSEIVGGHIGKDSSLEAAQAVYAGIAPVLAENGIWLAAQCCEHLNRAIIIEREAAEKYGWEEVCVVPRPHAGGSWATTCWKKFREPVAVEEIRAHAGIDIGGSLLRKTVSYGWASAMQQATVQLGKIAVQAIVNTMGVSTMAAFTAASRIDDFAYTPQQNIGHAMTTLMAQNRGAGKHDRVKQGFLCGMRIEGVYGVLIAVVCFSGAPFIMKLFVTDPEVIHLGVRFLRTVSLFYLMPAFTNGIQGFFRGVGDLKVTLVSSTINMLFRAAAAAVFVLMWKLEIEALPYSYVVGWVVMLAYELPLLVRYLRSHEDEL